MANVASSQKRMTMRALGTCSNAEISPGSSKPEDNPTRRAAGRPGAFLLWQTRSDSNPYSICCSCNPTSEHVETVSPGWKQGGTYLTAPEGAPACQGPWHTQAHLPHVPLPSGKIPAVRGFHPVSEESRAARKDCIQQEPQFHLPKILPFTRARFFFLSSLFCCLLLTFKCMAFFLLEIVWLLMVHSKKILPQGLAFAFNFGVLTWKKLWSLVTVGSPVLFREWDLGKKNPQMGRTGAAPWPPDTFLPPDLGPPHQQPLPKYLKSFLDAFFYFSSQSGPPLCPPHTQYLKLFRAFSVFSVNIVVLLYLF